MSASSKRSTRLVAKRKREEDLVAVNRNGGQPQTTIPMIVLLTHVFPFAFDTIAQAASLTLVCKLLHHWFRHKKEFWNPFLTEMMDTRFHLMERGHLLAKHYIMWPECILNVGGVIGVVQSKIIFWKSQTGHDGLYCLDKAILMTYARKYRWMGISANDQISVYYRNWTQRDGLGWKCIERLPFGEPHYTGGVIVPRTGRPIPSVSYFISDGNTMRIDITHTK